MGIDPHPHTLAELWTAAKARCDENWIHTQHIMALIYNANTRGKPKRPADFPRWPKQATTADVAESWATLKALFKRT